MLRIRVAILALAMSVSALGGGVAAQEKKGDQKGAGDQHHAAYEACAKACGECQRMCDMCAAHCAKLLADGKKDHLKTLQTCQDCATHCAAAACIVSRAGPFADLICTACAEACKRCGDACQKFSDDPMMKRCADECKACEKACRDMLKHVGSAGR